MPIIPLLFTLLVLGFFTYGVRSAPMLEPWFKNIIVGVIVLVVIWLVLGGFGLVPAGHLTLK